jgi:hypothetical protein
MGEEIPNHPQDEKKRGIAAVWNPLNCHSIIRLAPWKPGL